MNIDMNIIEERLSLIFDRINSADVKTEVPEKFAEYCEKAFAFMKLMRESYDKIQEGFLQKASLDELRSMNHEIYQELLGQNYETSYANPAYACEKLGLNMGRMLSFLYTELRAMIPFVYEGMLEEMVIRMELFMEIYQSLVTAREEGLEDPDEKELRESLYWFVSDYSDTSAEWRVRTQVNPECDFATKIVMNSDLSDVRYLYQYGEYITEGVGDGMVSSPAKKYLRDSVDSLKGNLTTRLADVSTGIRENIRGILDNFNAPGINKGQFGRFAYAGINTNSVPSLSNGGRGAAEDDPVVVAQAQANAKALAEYLLPFLSALNGGNDDDKTPVYVGTLIADDEGLKQLERKLKIIRKKEEGRGN